MEMRDIPTGRFMTQTLDEIDYVQDGVVYHGVHTSNVQVGDADELELLAGYTPGTIAHTAGYKKMWELDTDGETWAPIQE